MHALLNKTIHSHGRSTLTVQQLVSYAAQTGVEVVGLTDTHSLNGVPEFLLACEKAGVHGVAGLTVFVNKPDGLCGEITVLAKGDAGYLSLIELLERAKHVSAYRSHSPTMGILLEDLLSGSFKEIFQHLVCVDGYPGSVGEYLAKEVDAPSLATITAEFQRAGAPLHTLRTQFPAGAYMGVQQGGRKNAIAYAAAQSADARAGNPLAIQTSIASAFNHIELAATKQLFTEYAKDWLSQFPEGDVGNYINRLYKDQVLACDERPAPEGIFATAAQLKHLLPTPHAAYKSKPISDRIVSSRDDDISLSDLMNKVWPAFKESLLPEEVSAYSRQIRHELGVIKSMGYEDYFLNIYKIKQLTDDMPGNAVMLRGSAVGSLVMYVLKLTPIDPLKNGLLFARFLSEHRNEEPDVDMEFVDPVAIRRALPGRFDNGGGADNPQFVYISDANGVANGFELLSMARRAMETYTPRSEAQKKSIHRAFEILTAYAYVRGTKEFHKFGKKKKWEDVSGDLAKTAAKMPTFTELHEMLASTHAISRGIWSSKVSAASIVIVPEGAGRHFNLLPSREDAEKGDLLRIPLTKSTLSATGFIKYDILFNHAFKRTMNSLALAGIDPNTPIKPNDPIIGYLFKKQAFMGICQLNAFAGDRLAKQMEPSSYEDLTALFALIRDASGKEDNETIKSYLHNKANPSSLQLPEGLRPILAETHGALLYEEQLMRILIDVGGFDWAEADAFRSSLKKGKYEVIAQYEPRFLAHVQQTFSLSLEEANAWYQPLRDKHGRFVFSKAHAVAYAHLAVQQCYLKGRCPAVYYAELFMDKVFTIKGSKVPLDDMLSNWSLQLSRTLPDGQVSFIQSPQSMLDFVDAVVAIIKREMNNPSTDYRVKDLAAIRVEIESVLSKLSAYGLLPAGVEPQQYNLMLLGRFESGTRGLTYAAKSPERVHGEVGAGSPRAKASPPSVSGGESDSQRGNLNELLTGTLVAGAKPLNGNEKIDLSKDVMLGHFLWFMAKLGHITTPSIDTSKSAANDHFRFHGKKEDGTIVSYHISAPSLSPERAAKLSSKHSLTSGCFQGGDRNMVGLVSAEHLMAYFCHDGIVRGAPKVSVVPNPKIRDTFYQKMYPVQSFLKELVKNSSVPLYGIGALRGEFSSGGIDDPIFSIFPASPESKDDKFKSILQETLIDGRGFDPEHFEHLFKSGSLMFGSKFGKLNQSKREKGGAYRMDTRYIFAQFRLPDGKTPIWKLPMPEPGCFASGGHQSIFWARDKQKVSRPDHATNRVLGHFYGDPVPGSKVLWVTEGVFDSMAFNELQNTLPAIKGDVSWAEPNSISIKSAGGGVRFLNKVLGVKIEFNKPGEQESVDFVLTDHAVSTRPLSEPKTAALKAWMQKRKVHWLDDPLKPESTQMMKSLLKTVDLSAKEMSDHVKVHRCKPGESQAKLHALYKHELSTDDSVLLHAGNLEHWMFLNSLKFEPDTSATGEYKIMQTQESRVGNDQRFSSMTPEQQKEVAASLRVKFKEMTGASALGSALDGDKAGLLETAELSLFAKTIGLPFATFIPLANEMEHPKTKEVLALKDHNDYLKVIRRFQKENLYAPLFDLLAKYHASYKVSSPQLLLTPGKPVISTPEMRVKVEVKQ